MTDATPTFESFSRNGFCVFEQVLPAKMIKDLSDLTDTILAEQDESHFASKISQGSMVMIDWALSHKHRLFAEFITNPNTLVALANLGFDEPKFGHGRIISKPPYSPQLFWHEDGRFWNDPVSYTTQPIQVFLMYYLTDTRPENGCLRVIPGSHLKRHLLHDQISERHTDQLSRFENPEDPEFSFVENEIDVPLRAGDVVLGYGSLLHASHANRSDERRTVLTMWYYPDFANLPDRTKATVALAEKRTGEVEEGSEAIEHLLEPLRVSYDGDAQPIEHELRPLGLK